MKRTPRTPRNRRAPALRTAPAVLGAALILAFFCAACGQRGPLYLPDAEAPANEAPADHAGSPADGENSGDSEKDDASPA